MARPISKVFTTFYGSRVLSKPKLRRVVLGFETLEARQLLASDLSNLLTNADDTASRKPVVGAEIAKPTHSYFVGSEQLGMVVHPTRVALAVNGTVDELAQDGLTFVRQINPEFSVYEGEEGTIAGLVNGLVHPGSVMEVLPVFVLTKSQSEAVLVDELIVSLKPGISASDYFASRPEFASYVALQGTSDQFIATVAAGSGEVALDVLNSLRSDEQLAWIEPNFYQDWQKFYLPNDPRIGNQWHLENTGQGGGLPGADANLAEAWDVLPGGSANITIGIIDDGIAIDHPDLNPWVNIGEIPGNSIDDDGNGWIDDVHGWNFVNNNASSVPTTASDVHGTSVAGVAAARGDNAIGVAGASYNSAVLSARIFEGNAVASDANIAAALYYAAGRTANGLGTWKAADVLNNSWGGGGSSSAINGALNWGTTAGRQGQGATILFASGNTFGGMIEPAIQSLNIPGVLAVGATNNRGELSDYSGRGIALDLVAPSNDTRAGYLSIDTTDRIGGDGYDPSDYTGTGVNGFGGTSSATPLAAGIAALVLARADELDVDLTPAQLRDMFRNNTDLVGTLPYDLVSGKNNDFGYGRIDAGSAVAAVGGATLSVVSTNAEYFPGETYSFDSTYVDEPLDMTFRIRNQGTSPLEISGMTIGSGPFEVVSGNVATTIGVGGSTIFTIRFLPTTGGEHTSTLMIASNDANFPTFNLPVSGMGIEPMIGGAVFEDWNGNGIFDAADRTRSAGEMVYIDANGNEQFDGQLSIETYVNNTPTAILDRVTVTSTITVAGFTDFVTDINVMFDASHTYVSDLDVILISPNGTRIPLIIGVGDSGDNFVGTILDDEAEIAIEDGAAPFTGSFRPTSPLSILAGTDVNGIWTLEIFDLFDADEGILNSWGLTIAGGEQLTRTRESGFYAFGDLPTGTYTIRSNPSTGWTASVLNEHVVTIDSPTASIRGQDFGQGKNDRFYAQVFHDNNSDGNFDTAEAPLPGRTVYLDANDNGVFEAPQVTTLANTTAVPVPDETTQTSTITVSGVAGEILDVNVQVNIATTWAADVDLFLVHPDGTRIELFTDVGGSGDNFVDTILDDSAALSILSGIAPFTGTFRPEGVLGVVNGKTPNGIWTLEIRDDAGGDVTALIEWELILTAGEVSIATNETGTGSMDISAGTHRLRLDGTEGWVHTLPVDGLREVTTSDVPMYGQLYGSTLADAIPPTVPSVIAGSTEWLANYIDFVDGGGAGAGNGSGFELLGGGLPTLRTNDVNRLYVMFSEEVTNLSSSTLELRNSTQLIPFTLAYNPTTSIATLSLSSPLAFGKYRLAVSDAVTDASGNQLDGDGSSAAGGIFNFRFNVVPGDASGDGRVNGADLTPFSLAFNSQIGQPAYNVAADWNGDGRVNGGDLTVFSANFNRNVNNLAEPAAPFGGSGQGASRNYSGRDRFFFDFARDDDDEEEDEKNGDKLELVKL